MDDYQTLAVGVSARFFSEFHNQNPLCRRYTRKESQESQLRDMVNIAMEEPALEELGAQPNSASKDGDEVLANDTQPSKGDEVTTI
eukprot:CAMPEP_0169099652 /NCGR_PEP_ID=MMETSP1015-20121227/20672_1 /TAXON_ID=342587 /ORGANISM="Karlodinium micrum, Strain CCMP2283" /LENGTH=85 /DNA_ID=CAMNT_0009160549 /DNA_START=21 /DNA_END=278 /DNA_ORIENTATION=+